MSGQKLSSDFYSALAWAIFTLGASQLALVLGGPATLLVVLSCCASLFVIFLFKVREPKGQSLKQIAKPYLLATGILLAGNLVYVYLVFLKSNWLNVSFFIIYAFFFILPLLITIPFVRKSSHVSQ